jgi:excisionase family DNA binding protein
MKEHVRTGGEEPVRLDSLLPVLDVNTTARYLSTSRRTVYALVHAGALRPLRVGRRMRFRVADLDEYLERGSP